MDVSRSMLTKAIIDGRLRPDARLAKSFLFREDRLNEVAAVLRVLYEEKLAGIVSVIRAADQANIEAFVAQHQHQLQETKT